MAIGKTNWDLSYLIPNPAEALLEEKRANLLAESYKFIDKWKNRTDYLEQPEILLEALQEYEHWAGNFGTSGNEGYYLSLQNALDQTNPQIKAQLSKLTDTSNKIANDIQFFTYHISKIPLAKQQQFLAEPRLANYKHFLETLFANAKYLLTEAEEKILNLVSETSYANWVQMTSEFLAAEERIIVTANGKREKRNFAELTAELRNTNKQVRDNAAKAFNSILKKYAPIAEHELNSILKNKKTIDELRNIARPDIPRHISDDIDTQVVDKLIETVAGRFAISQNFYELKAKLFNVDKLAYYERTVPYGNVARKYTYEDAQHLILKTFNKLDKKFGTIFEDFAAKGLIDVFPKKGKVGGAFCSRGLAKQPSYVLLNYTQQLADVTTIAHEMGHAIHDVLMKEKQSPVNQDTSLAIAETASTFMEDFVLEEIMQEADEETRLAIQIAKLDDDVAAIQRQIACYRFEQELHTQFREIGYLTKEHIGKLFQKHMQAYMGNFVDQPTNSQNWWVYWGHIRRFFYVYSYASGLLISKAFQSMVKSNPIAIDKFKQVLAAGSSKAPAEIFAKAGIDITAAQFWHRGLDAQNQLLENSWKLAKKLGKI